MQYDGEEFIDLDRIPKIGSFESKRRLAIAKKYYVPDHSHLLIPDTPEEAPAEWGLAAPVQAHDTSRVDVVTSTHSEAGVNLKSAHPALKSSEPSHNHVRHVITGESPVDSPSHVMAPHVDADDADVAGAVGFVARPKSPVPDESEVSNVYNRAKVPATDRNIAIPARTLPTMDYLSPPRKKRKRTAPLHGAILPCLVYEANRGMFASKTEIDGSILEHYGLLGVSRFDVAAYVAKEFKRKDEKEYNRFAATVKKKWSTIKKEKRACTIFLEYPEWKMHFLLTGERLKTLAGFFRCYLCDEQGLLMRCENPDCCNQAHPSCEGINMQNTEHTCPTTYYCRACLPLTRVA